MHNKLFFMLLNHHLPMMKERMKKILTIKMEGLSNIGGHKLNLLANKGTSSKHVCNPILVKTKGKPSKPSSNF